MSPVRAETIDHAPPAALTGVARDR
jgi:hypothetical protein